jgi:hypothetical protein
MRLRLRGVGPGVISTYLVDLGGREEEPGKIAGDGWEASVTAGELVSVGAIRLGVTEVEFSGEPLAVSRLREAFEKKVVRAGG